MNYMCVQLKKDTKEVNPPPTTLVGGGGGGGWANSVFQTPQLHFRKPFLHH